MCVWTRKYSGQKIFEIGLGGWGTPHRPIFSTCIETTLKIGAILMKFTQDVRKYPGQKIFEIGRGTPHGPIFLTCMETTLKWRDLNEIYTGYVYGRENIPDKKFFKSVWGVGYHP